jgi:SAM-dependent methyltransferase
VARSEERFQENLDVPLESFKGKLVLDAGCGMGRFAEVVAKYGATVVAVDLSYAVDAAATNLSRWEHAHVLQADLRRLPLRQGVFDFVYSLGVLHHTPDPRATFNNLLPFIKPGGRISITLYSRYNTVYVISTTLWRWLTRRLPGKLVYAMSHLAIPLYHLYRIPLLGLIGKGMWPISMDPDPQWRLLDTFDCYTPRYQFSYTHPEVYRWFHEGNLQQLQARGPGVSFIGTRAAESVEAPGRNGANAHPKVLYLSYDGLLEPLGHSQILPYLRGLGQKGAQISLISFEKRADQAVPGQLQSMRAQLWSSGIRWLVLTYHKRPSVLATSFDVFRGTIRAWMVLQREGVRIVHARSYVAALMAWLLKRLTGVRFIFDMRGFWVDERVEGRIWASGGALFRLAKRLEQRFLQDADEIITLTERAQTTLERWPGISSPRVTVIPTCVDLDRFPAPARSENPRAAPTFIYAGSLGTWYLLREMLQFVEAAARRFPDARLLLLSRNRHEALRELRASGCSAQRVTVDTVMPHAVPGWLARAHVGLAFYKGGFSRQGTCPTKIGEYLAMGLPVVVNDAVGDARELIGGKGVGVVLSEFSPEAYGWALHELERLWADPALAARCRQVAESHFSLQGGVERYWAIYQRLTS